MAGTKGHSGGARDGSGPDPKPPTLLNVTADEPLDFLLAVMKDPSAPAELRVRAAVCAAQYVHTRTKDGGKNVVKTEAAKEVATSGKYAPGAPPRLAVDNSK